MHRWIVSQGTGLFESVIDARTEEEAVRCYIEKRLANVNVEHVGAMLYAKSKAETDAFNPLEET